MLKHKPSWFASHLPDYVIIYASKLAGCAGMHKYQSQIELKSELMAYIHRDDSYIHPDEKAKSMIEALPMPKREAIKSIMESNVISNVQTIQDVVKQVVDLKSVDKEIIDLVKSTLYTKNGTHAEEGIRNKFESAVKTKVNTFTRFKTSDLPIAIINNVEVYIGGKHDGQMNDDTIIEIKNRQRGFLGVPIYEKVQVHAYMYIYGMKKAMLVESYKGEERKHEMEFDDEFWSEVKNNVETFVESCQICNS